MWCDCDFDQALISRYVEERDGKRVIEKKKNEQVEHDIANQQVIIYHFRIKMVPVVGMTTILPLSMPYSSF